jgi:hypothetical protein
MSDMTQCEWSPSVGDCVRVKDPRGWIARLRRQLADRDGVVLLKWRPTGTCYERVKVRFGRRNGRGKEFELTCYATDLMPWPASQEEDR